MGYRLDTSGRAPLHKRVERMMRQLIAESPYCDGEFLPKEVEISEKLGVSRNTVRFAISKRRKGIGTRVAPKRIPTRLDSWWSFTREMQSRGIEVVNYEIDVRIVRAGEEVAEALHVNQGVTLIEVLRLRGTETGPSLLTISSFHPRLKMTGHEDFYRPMYQMLEEDLGIIAAFSREEISAIAADEWLADKLNLEVGDPVLYRRRIVSDTDGQLIEYNKVYYKGEGFSYSIDIAKG
jgi:GntR family transcriptional regulator